MTDGILIVGGGVAGLTAAGVCADAGAQVTVVENGPIIGGRLAPLMTGSQPNSEGVDLPAARALAQRDNVEVITLGSLERLEGRPGNFSVSITERARFVTDACTRCGHCRPVCPSVSSNAYDQGLTYRKAVYAPLPESHPMEYVIDIDSCLNRPPNYLPCNRCIEVCDDDAIHFDVPLVRAHERQVGAVILSAGFDVVNGNELKAYGYGVHPDVVTSAELQRLLMAPGPTGGFAARPSNEDYPDRVLLILEDLTPFSTYTAASQIRQLLEQDVGNITVLSTTQARGGESSLLEAMPEKVSVVFGLLKNVEANTSGGITVTYADFSGTRVPRENFDLVVLDSQIQPAATLAQLAEASGCDLTGTGYIAIPQAPCTTSQPGIFAAGGACGPATLPEAVAGARSAATAALAQLDPRLLKPGYAPVVEGESAAEPEALSVDEMRARIERALNALIQ